MRPLQYACHKVPDKLFRQTKRLTAAGPPMRKLLIAGAFGLVLFVANFTYAVTLHFRMTTDQAVYQVGDQVNWTVWAWVSQEGNRGMAKMAFDLDDDQNEVLEPAWLNSAPHEFLDTDYGQAQGFNQTLSGTQFPDRPRLRSLSASQTVLTKTLDIGNDGLEHVLAKGTYTVNTLGTHKLAVLPDLSSSLYWTNDGVTPAFFSAGNIISATFTVTHESDVNYDLSVDMIDFSLMGKNWMIATICDADNSWCDFSDIDRDGAIGIPDLEFMSSQWLGCVDPNSLSCTP